MPFVRNSFGRWVYQFETLDFRTDRKCLAGCGNQGTIPLHESDRWGGQHIRGHVCKTCHGEP